MALWLQQRLPRAARRPLQMMLFASLGAISACNSITHMAPVTTSVASSASATASAAAVARPVASAPAIVASSVHTGSTAPGRCPLPAPIPKQPPVSPPSPPPPEPRPSLVCGAATVNMFTDMAPSIHVVAASAAASAARPAAAASATVGYPYLADAMHLGKVAASVMAALALLLLCGGLFFGGLGSESRHRISFDGNAGGFGGRAWGWRASPALAMLAASAVALVLAIGIVWQVVEVGRTPIEVRDLAAAASSE